MIDISVPLRVGMDVWEGDPPFERTLVCNLESEGCNVSKLTLSSHSGTHVDAPVHFIAGGGGIEGIPLDVLIGKCQVLEISDEDLENNLVPRGALEKVECPRVILKTRNSRNPGVFSKDAVAVSLEAAKLINEKGVKLIGVDGFSVESYSGDGSVHRELLSHNVVIVETLNLSGVSPGFYELVCLPVNVVGGDGAPARALLRSL